MPTVICLSSVLNFVGGTFGPWNSGPKVKTPVNSFGSGRSGVIGGQTLRAQ